MAEATLHVKMREEKGKQVAKHLRKEGFVPGVIYGPGEDPSMLAVDDKELFLLLHTYGRNVVVNITPEGSRKKIKTFIYEIQHDPISGNIIHVDFKHISLKEKIHVSVPVVMEGVPEGVKNEGGMLDQSMHTVDISCLPTDIPVRFVIDVSALVIGDTVHVNDIEKGDFEFLSDMDGTIAHVIPPRLIIEVEEEEEVLDEEGPAEPEVIGQKEESGEE